MGCSDGLYLDRLEEEKKEKRNKKRREAELKRQAKIEAMLCGVLTSLEDLNLLGRVLSNINWKKAGVDRDELSSWWKQHKECEKE